MSGYKHIIWDWNGTLLNDVWLCLESINQLLGEHQLGQIGEVEYRERFEFPVIRFYERMGFEIGQEAFAKVSAQFIGLYETRRDECHLHAGAREALSVLRDAGISQSILSAYKQDTLEEVVTRHDLGGFFEDLVGLDNILAHGKADVGLAWLQQSAKENHELLLIGDTLHDHEVAMTLGVDCWLMGHGHHTPERLKGTGSPVFGSFEEVMQALKRNGGIEPFSTPSHQPVQ